MPPPSLIQKAVAAYFAAIRARDPDAWVGTFADDGVSYDPVGAAPTIGRSALTQFFQTIAGVFETLSITEDHVFVAGSGVAVKWTGRGVGLNGVAVTFEGIDVFEVNAAGRIQKLWGYWNPEPLMAQLLA